MIQVVQGETGGEIYLDISSITATYCSGLLTGRGRSVISISGTISGQVVIYQKRSFANLSPGHHILLTYLQDDNRKATSVLQHDVEIVRRMYRR